jgi:hypothetical protein
LHQPDLATFDIISVSRVVRVVVLAYAAVARVFNCDVKLATSLGGYTPVRYVSDYSGNL